MTKEEKMMVVDEGLENGALAITDLSEETLDRIIKECHLSEDDE